MRYAVVSGGGTGIGAATARHLAEQGCQVAIVGRRADVLAKAAADIGPSVTPIAADLSRPDEVSRVVEAVGEREVDILVNNAGGYLGSSDGSLASEAEWWRQMLDANLMTAVLLTEGLRGKLRRPGGRVIMVSSIAAQRGGGGPYSAAKAALHGWTYALAAELGPDGITVNVVSPGYVTDTDFFAGRMTPEGHDRRVAQTLVGRAGEPAEVAAAIGYLTSPAAGYVTGQVFGINGGSVLGR